MKVISFFGRIVILVAFLCPLITEAQSTNQVYINEINYRAVEKQQNIDFVELYNAGSQTVDLTGWFLTGGLDYTFPAASIAPGAYLVVAANPGTVQSEFGVSGVLGPWSGKLSSSEDKVVLRTSNYEVIDRVEYEDWREWPNVRFADDRVTQGIPQNPIFDQEVTVKVAKSIQKINPIFNGNHGGSWEADDPTPTQVNATFNSNTLLPVVKSVSKSPDKPASGEDVRIKVDFADHELYENILDVTVEYQINNAGDYKMRADADYTFISKTMYDDGDAAVSGDSTANNGLYTAIIPGDLNRTLVRYKIKVETNNGYIRYFPDTNHNEDNYSYYIYDGDVDFEGYSIANLNPLQNITIISKLDTIDKYVGIDVKSPGDLQYNGYEYGGEGTLIYNGKIFDHINFRPRGKTRNNRIKPGIKFKLNKEKGIKIENDCGKDYNEERDNLILSGTWVSDQGSHGLVESLVYKILELTKGWYTSTDYVSLRIVDDATEADKDGDFWGIFLMIEDNNGELLKEHDLPDGNIWTTYDGSGIRFMYVDYFGNFAGYDDPATWLNEPATDVNVTPDPLTLNKEMFFGDRIGNEFWANGESNYYKKHSYREYYNPETDTWMGWCKDYDGSFGKGNNVQGVKSTSFSDPQAEVRHPLTTPGILEEEYKSALRSAIDLLLNPEQINFLIDNELEKIYDDLAPYDWTTLDAARWDSIEYSRGNVDAQFAWYRSWFESRRDNYLLTNSDRGVADNLIPDIPVIQNSGGTALDDLSFTQDPFSDGGSSVLDGWEWRIGEWSDPNNPFYDDKCEPKYEIETVWASGEIGTALTEFDVPAEAQLKVGRTYKIRVRHKNLLGKWSHWSNAITIVPTPASPVNSDLVINEIMYNPAERYTEFIEIHNTGGAAVSLDNVRMTKGIEFDFPVGSSIAADEYLILAEDSIEFFNIHGFYPFGEYKSSLSNSGEYLELTGPFRTVLDSLSYGDSDPWPGVADNGFYSLGFVEELADNAVAANWGIQSIIQTPGLKNEFNDLGQHGVTGIVINEIHYNPFDGVNPDDGSFVEGQKFEFIELKNTSATTIDLSGAYFTQGITYYFPDGTFINSGDFIVLAEDKSSFEDRYNFAPFDKYDGKLSDNGESIYLFNKDNLLLDAVTYQVGFPWDSEANGGTIDYSLALIDAEVNNETRLNWQTQCNPTLWTPGAENDFGCFPGLQYDGLVINEIHYGPADGNDVEYIEIINSSNFPLELEQVNFASGIIYTFDQRFLPGAVAYPNNYIVLARNATAYQDAYGHAPDGVYGGGFSSNGENVVLQDLFGETIDQVNYDEIAPWPVAANQGQYSLALIDPTLDNSLASSWCIQDPSVKISPNEVNVFGDSDGDGVIDCLDVCANFNDNLIGSACNDNDPCTIGETYTNCGCSGGVTQDSDSDGVCDFFDACPGFDDNIDVNGNGTPDACEPGEGCENVISELNTPTITSNAQANIEILTNGKVNNGSNIEYKAGNNIELMPLFEVKLGAIYHAHIEPCN